MWGARTVLLGARSPFSYYKVGINGTRSTCTTVRYPLHRLSFGNTAGRRGSQS